MGTKVLRSKVLVKCDEGLRILAGCESWLQKPGDIASVGILVSALDFWKLQGSGPRCEEYREGQSKIDRALLVLSRRDSPLDRVLGSAELLKLKGSFAFLKKVASNLQSWMDLVAPVDTGPGDILESDLVYYNEFDLLD